jgi:hypothetical protein
MYVHGPRYIAHETYTDCATPGPRLLQARSSDALLRKPCSSKNSPRPSYRLPYDALPYSPVPYHVIVCRRSTEPLRRFCQILATMSLYLQIAWSSDKYLSLHITSTFRLSHIGKRLAIPVNPYITQGLDHATPRQWRNGFLFREADLNRTTPQLAPPSLQMHYHNPYEAWRCFVLQLHNDPTAELCSFL